MKKIISLLVSLTLMLSIVPMTVMADGTGWDGVTTTEITNGTGTSTDPYLISTPEELAWARDAVNAGTANSAYFKLTADIDLNNQEWTPIGNTTNTFTGNFNGAGYAVKNVLITTPANSNYTGFFCHVAGTIKNLGLDGVTIQVEQNGGVLGGMIGRGYGTFENCYVKNASIRNTSTATNIYERVGGFIGRIRATATIKNCYVYNTVLTGSPRSVTGGFFGDDEGTSDTTVMTNCYVADVERVGFDGVRTSVFYGFGKKRAVDDATSTVNSYSTVIGSNGTYPETNENYRYQSTMSIGNEGATKEGIITALVTDGGSYIVDADVNDGYPCLDYEKPALVAANAYAGGTGTSTDPYQIATAEQLMYARDMVNAGDHRAKSFVLTADIDLEGTEWEPMGTFWKDGTSDAGNYFSGTFNGNNHIVKNFIITQSYHNNIGFFGYTSSATIKNLGIEDMNINYTAANGNVGGMIGYGNATLTNCYIKNSSILTALRYYPMGGFIGKTRFASTIENCYVYGCTLRAKDNGYVGGFIGSVERAGNTVTNCYVANTKVDSGNQAAVYPFIFNKNLDITLTKCYSDLAPVEGSTTNANNKYNADYADGTYTAVKSDITGAFETVEGFKLDNAINGGYPALSFETAPVVVVPNPYVIAAVNTNGMVKVTILENSAVSGANVYVASYDGDGRLLGADVLQATAGTQTSTVDATGATTIKVFVWNPDQMPIANMYSK